MRYLDCATSHYMPEAPHGLLGLTLPLSLSLARQRKDELEQRMSALQESRRELMVQLEQLMMLLKVTSLLCHSVTHTHGQTHKTVAMSHICVELTANSSELVVRAVCIPTLSL